MDHQAYAKRLLVHYFELVYNETTGGSLTPDCVSEIESIVDSIIEAAAAEGARRALQYISASVIE